MMAQNNTLLLLLTVLVALLACSAPVSATYVRGGVAASTSKVSESESTVDAKTHRVLQKEDDKDDEDDEDEDELEIDDEDELEDFDPDMDDEDEDEDEDGEGATTTTIAGFTVIIPDENQFEDLEGLVETKPCEPDAARAIEFVSSYGQFDQEDASEACFLDPVNGCGGGCCRLGIYFICDEGTFAPHLPCVCNSNTAPLPPPVVNVPAVPEVLPNPQLDPALPDIVDTAVGAGSFNTLVELVATAGLVTTLRSPGPFTVFAPTDAAFPSGVALEEFKNSTSMEELSRILTFHVVPGVIMAADLEEGATVTTVEGNDLTVTLAGGAKVNNATILRTDIETSNGVIHVIDSVLMPPPVVPDIVDTAIAAGDFTTLVDLVATADLVETLKSPGPFTVFAPNDQAFPTGDALAEFKASTDIATLASILTYHVIPGKIMSRDLVDGATVDTVQGTSVEISLSDEGAMVNEANIITADIETSNGVIHVIDGILMPTVTTDVQIARTPP